MKKSGSVFIGVGTNLGNRLENIRKAYALMESYVGKIGAQSSVYVSPPWGFEAKEDFYNTVIELDTNLTPDALITILKNIETEMGRIKTKADGYESRLIDLDILDFGSLVSQAARLELPHPNLHRRGFVLWPLREICPQWVHPVSGKKITELIDALNPSETAEKLDDTNV